MREDVVVGRNGHPVVCLVAAVVVRGLADGAIRRDRRARTSAPRNGSTAGLLEVAPEVVEVGR